MNILFITALVPLVLALVSFAVPPAIFSDSAFGFLVFQGMEEGAGFNMDRMPDLENISKDRDKFMTWWSPGQYLVPGIFLVLGCNHGWAIVFAVLLCSWMGLWGWVTVAQKAGAGKWTQILFLLGLVTFRHGTLPFRIYNGGEILLFAAAPWGFLLLQRSLTGGFWSGFIAALGSAMLLFFAKLTGLIVFAVSGVSLVALDLWQKRMVRPPVVGLFAGAVLAALIVGWGWMSRGGTPMVSESAPAGMEAFLFPPAAAVFSGFSLHEFLARLLIHPDRAVLPGKDVGVTSWILGPAALVSLVWIWQKLRRDPTSRAWMALVGPLVVVQSFFFVVLYGKGSAVSVDERHLRFAGILMFLSMLMAAERCGVLGKRIMSGVVLLCGAYGVASFATGVWQAVSNGKTDSVSGIQQNILSPKALAWLRQRAMPGEKPVAVVSSPEAGLALPGWRIIALHLDFTKRENLEQQRWLGRVPELYIVVQPTMETNGKAGILLSSFHDYRPEEWTRTVVDGTVIYHAGRSF